MRELNPTRLELLERRRERQAELDAGALPEFVPAPEPDWEVAQPPADLRDRRVEITGPLDRKMTINAMNSGARVFMADFEDAMSPTWENVVQGQRNLADAVRGTIELDTGEKTYRLNEETAVLVPRPRGWHPSDSARRAAWVPLPAPGAPSRTRRALIAGTLRSAAAAAATRSA